MAKLPSETFYNREKHLDLGQVADSTVYQYDHDGTLLWTDTSEDILRERSLDTYGVNLKNFRKRVKAGNLLPITAFSQWERDFSAAFSYSVRYTSTSWHQYCDWTDKGEKAPSIDIVRQYRDLGNDLVQEAAAKIYSSGWDSLTFLAELHKVVAMFRNLVSRLIDLLRKGKLESLWLEGRYGWRILVYDIRDIQEALTGLESERTRFKDSAGTTSEHVKTSSEVWTFGGAGTAMLLYNDEIVVGRRGTVVADIEPPEFRFNPITTAWELITFSFVIDWVIRIGQFLEALSFLTLNTRYVAGVGNSINYHRTVTVGDISPNPGWSISAAGKAEGYTKLEQRVSASVPYLPQISLDLTWLKIADLIALFVQLLRGK